MVLYMSIEKILDQLTDGAYSAWHVAPTPWTFDDMQVYYAACQHDTKMAGLLDARCQMHQRGHWVTPYDDLQLQRDAMKTEKNHVPLELFEQLRRQLPAEQFEQMLFMLLSIYRKQLSTAHPDDDMSDVCLRIDMINRHFSYKIMQAIESKQSDSSWYKTTLVNLGALTYEVLPWLSVRLRENIFDDNSSDADVNTLLYSAMSFYRATSSNLDITTSLNPIVRQRLSAERATWRAMDNEKKPQETLLKWALYLDNTVLSPLILERIKERIFGMLVCSRGQHQKHIMLVLAMLTRVNEISPLTLNTCMSSLIGTFLPISAGLFYARLKTHREESIALIQDYAETAPDVLKEIMILIFSDKRYLASHLELLEAEVHPALTSEQYPLYMFRKHCNAQSGNDFSYGDAVIKTTFEIEHGSDDRRVAPLPHADMLCNV
jgi:hypothetical protein